MLSSMIGGSLQANVDGIGKAVVDWLELRSRVSGGSSSLMG